MTEIQLLTQERLNAGTSWTRNEQFEKNGYIVLKDLWDPEELYAPAPKERGQLNYHGTKQNEFTYDELERQVECSLSRYHHPQYRKIHHGIRKKLEKAIGRTLYTTYYYDRFYFEGLELTKHADRPACEISVTVHVSTNLPDGYKDWPVWIKTPDIYTDKTKSQILVPGQNSSVVLNPGDGMIYKGCERPHWREPMEVPKRNKLLNWFKKDNTEYYYHQIFFHYVLQDGQRAHMAWDKSKWSRGDGSF